MMKMNKIYHQKRKGKKSKENEVEKDHKQHIIKEEETERKVKKKKTKEYSPDSDFSDDNPKKKKNRKASSTLLSSEITKNTTREDLTAYILKDLQQYCRENSISYIGRKSELITRIITFLETGEKPVKRKYTKRRR